VPTRYKRGTIALLLSPVGLLIISATRLLIISDYNTTTATAVAASGGYVNTLLGSVIPLVPLLLPYLALALWGFKRLLLSALAIAAALFISPAEVTFPKLIYHFSRHDFDQDVHRFAVDHLSQTGWTAAVLLVAAAFAAWEWDRDVRENVVADVAKINGIVRPVSKNHNPEIRKIARDRNVTERTAALWADGITVRYRSGTVFITLLACIASIAYVSYFYPIPRSVGYYETILRTPWIPAERLELRSGSSIVGYPLTTDGDWMVILTNSSRSIQYIRAANVAARIVCNSKDQSELAATAPPIFTLLKSKGEKTPPCGNAPSIGLLTSKSTAIADRTSRASFGIIPRLSGIRICAAGSIVATLSVELHRIPAGFRIVINKYRSMKPGRVRFAPGGLHGSASFTFIAYEASSSIRPYTIDVEWRSPTGRTAQLERASISVRYRGIKGKCPP
jgi:hypothetical protein